VDSTFLLRVALETLGRESVLAITADSPLTSQGELGRAKSLAKSMSAEYLVVRSRDFDDPRLRANPPDRCYVCKSIRFGELCQLAQERGIQHLADGTNADDTSDYRPGAKAAEELGVVSPLRDAGLSKADIREASRELALPTADLPRFACLASRVPYGTPLSEDKLRPIERGEEALAELGPRQYRLRDHGDIARIEVLPRDFAILLARREQLAARLRAYGYRYIALDLDGYRLGSMNEALA